MLSLKSFAHRHVNPKRTIVELPQELLQHVLEVLEESCNGLLDDIRSCSLVCHTLRDATLPILFREIHLVGFHEHYHEHKSQGILTFPHLLRHVRVLYLWGQTKYTFAVEPRNGNFVPSTSPWVQTFAAGLNAMTSLSTIHCMQLATCTSTVRDILNHLPKSCRIEVIGYLPNHDNVEETSDLEHSLSVLLQTQIVKLAIGYFWNSLSYHPNRLFELPKIERINDDGLLTALDMSCIGEQPVLEERFLPSLAKSRTLEEVWLNDWYDILPRGDSPSKIHKSVLDWIPWVQIRRLALELNRRLLEFVEMLPLMVNLERLRLQSHDRDRRLAWPTDSACKTNLDYALGPQNGFPLSKLKKLVDLEVCQTTELISLEYVTVPSLRRLSVYRFSPTLNPFRTATEIEQAAPNMPHLESLCIDIGHIDKLWHPTAIPGVDVDVKVYAYLNAITKFPKLKFLRLHPAYHEPAYLFSDAPNSSQPLSDEQAVRVFNRLVIQRPTLQTLSISATRECIDQHSNIPDASNFESWLVRSWGENTILTTRNAAKNYEIKQVWVGERRLRTEVKKDTHPKPYISDLDGWTLKSRAHRKLEILNTSGCQNS